MPECASQPIGFVFLPLEIREKIYLQVLVRGAILVQHLNSEVSPWIWSIWNVIERPGFFKEVAPWTITGLLTVSKQISDEALNVLYGRNLFVADIDDGTHNKFLDFTTANIRRIRHLRLYAHPMESCFPDPMIFESQLWIPLLADLSQLCLVAEQPRKARDHEDAPSLEEDTQKWVAWLKPVLQYLAQNVMETTNVMIDDNELVETGEIVQECFGPRCEKVKTEVGCMIFTRGVFSSTAGYWRKDLCASWDGQRWVRLN